MKHNMSIRALAHDTSSFHQAVIMSKSAGDRAADSAEASRLSAEANRLEVVRVMDFSIRLRVDCLGGWSFVILALGAFVFLPATLFTGLYIKHTMHEAKESSARTGTAPTLKVIGLCFFFASMVLTMIGIGIHVMWMKQATAKKDREKELAMAARNNLFPKEATLLNGEASAEEGMSHSARLGVPLLIRDHPPPAQISQGQKESVVWKYVESLPEIHIQANSLPEIRIHDDVY